MFVKSYTATLSGIDALTVAVEANVSQGIGMYLVGLADAAVKESQERIRSAFSNSGFRMTGKRLVVNLSPASLRKEGSSYDLPIALAILAATGQLPDEKLSQYMLMGELSLDGSLLPVKGILPAAIRARQDGFRGIIIPLGNFAEAEVVDGLESIPVASLSEAVALLAGNITADTLRDNAIEAIRNSKTTSGTPCQTCDIPANDYSEDFSDVKGQAHVKRALEIAAAGGHNVIMIGSPGSGKTMLARRMPTIIPELTPEEALETTKIHSVSGKLTSGTGLLTKRPFRSPHHLTSQVALIGGGSNPQPGEVSLANNGILFLDELPEFGRAALEVLRQPMEDKKIVVSRARNTVEFPANFMLIASMNPCPCGYFNHPGKECGCPPKAVMKYMNRISGPLFDRIDMHIEVTPVPVDQLTQGSEEEPSIDIRRRVEAARAIQRERFRGIESCHTNSMMNSKMISGFARLTPEGATLLGKAMERLGLSARAHDRIIKVARTIADLSASDEISPEHIAEAINYRSLDRANWGLQ